MNCDELALVLTDFLEGDLSPAVESEAIEHVSSCRSCETRLGGTKQVIALSSRYASSPLDAAARDRLLAEFIEELG